MQDENVDDLTLKTSTNPESTENAENGLKNPQPEGRKDSAGEKEKKETNSKLELYDWVQCVVSALVIGILFFVFVARVVNVEGRSMYPTLHNGDKIITTRLFYKPKAGDVVVVQTNHYGPDPIVKRIIATEGQTVNIDFEAGIVYVDGVAQDEPYINAPTQRPLDFDGEVTVPEGCMFLMGDNRNESTDSRDERIGMVDERCIIGRAIFIIVPSGEIAGSLDWSRLGGI